MLDRVLPVLTPHQYASSEGRAVAIFQRASYWLHTLDKLTYPSDFQAAISCARALLEIAVDLSLLAADRTKYPMENLIAWERSMKLKHVNVMLIDAKRLGFAVDPVFSEWKAFNEKQVLERRNELWSGDHPEHWSGRGQHLQQAARAADTYRGDHALETYYVKRYRPLCWGTHGTGLQAVEGIGMDAFPFLQGEAIRDAAAFGMLCADRTLIYLNAMTPALAAEIDRTHDKRDAANVVGFMIQRHGTCP